jgi:hypothetical protein
MPLSGPFRVSVAFRTAGGHQIDFFHAAGTPGGDVLATVGSGPVMRIAAAVRVHGGVIRSAVAAGSRSDQITLVFLPAGGASPHSLSTVSVPFLPVHRSRGPFFVGLVLPVSPEFGFPTPLFSSFVTGGVGPFLGATPNPFDRAFVIPASSFHVFVNEFSPFGGFFFTNPFFNPFDTFVV